MFSRYKVLSKSIYLYSLLWIIYFLLVVNAEHPYYGSFGETAVINSGKFVLMILSFFILQKVFIPLAQNKKILLLVVSILVWLYILSVCNIGWRVFVVQKLYPETYAGNLYEFNFKYINRLDWIFGIYPFYFFKPALLFSLLDYIRDRKKIQIYEKEKIQSELQALKNQLHPHFLFNTMNNIYTLALEKNDNTPDSILKLSEILDYMLHKCGEKYVPIGGEIEHINNYLYFEKLRYGDERVHINFNHKVENENLRIAPLLLVTYIENAFKHGISDESQQGKIDISLSATADDIDFKITNSIPDHKNTEKYKEDIQIGLKNARRQLNILYPDEHQLNINENDNQYTLMLKLKTK